MARRRASRVALVTSRLSEIVRYVSAGRSGPLAPRAAPVSPFFHHSPFENRQPASTKKRTVRRPNGGVNYRREELFSLATQLIDDELADAPKLEPMHKKELRCSLNWPDSTKCQCFVCRRKRERRKGLRQKLSAQRALRNGCRRMLESTDTMVVFAGVMGANDGN